MSDYEDALEEAQAWLSEPGVIAVGQGEEGGGPTIDVWVKPVELRREIPTALRGFTVRVRDSGGDVLAGGSAP
jgi:hypothetical protein